MYNCNWPHLVEFVHFVCMCGGEVSNCLGSFLNKYPTASKPPCNYGACIESSHTTICNTEPIHSIKTSRAYVGCSSSPWRHCLGAANWSQTCVCPAEGRGSPTAMGCERHSDLWTESEGACRPQHCHQDDDFKEVGNFQSKTRRNSEHVPEICRSRYLGQASSASFRLVDVSHWRWLKGWV